MNDTKKDIFTTACPEDHNFVYAVRKEDGSWETITGTTKELELTLRLIFDPIFQVVMSLASHLRKETG